MHSLNTIPVFTGTNWSQWWLTITAYIKASGCSWAMDFPAQTLDPKANKEEHDFYIMWTKVNLTIISSIKLHLLDSLKVKYMLQTIAVDLIIALKAEYAAPRFSGVFALFKELLDMKIAQSSHSTPSLNKMAMLFPCLEARGYKFPENIQVMLLLAKLMPSMDVITQMIVRAKGTSGKAKTFTVEEIQAAVVLSWDQHHMKDIPKAAQANKISTIKHKGDDPKFEQQQVPQGDGSKKKCKCNKCAGNKKKKEKELNDSSSHMPILLWAPIPLALRHPWIPVPLPLAPP